MNEIVVPLKMNPDCLTLRLIWIEDGRFMMGDKEALGLDEIEDKSMGQFQVIFSRGFWLGVYPVTQCQWQAIMGTNPSHFKGANLPIDMIGWQDALDFCNRLNAGQLSVPEGYRFSLPTEAQWEYACRAGTSYKYQLGDTLEHLSRVAWHRNNTINPGIQNVGQKESNNWGLYDMLGNVMEWCFDSPTEYPNGTTQVDWVGQSGEGMRILRGGSAHTPPPPESELVTCSGRGYTSPEPNWFFGFRVCLRYDEPHYGG